mgnify:CR=1 FL=1
MDPSLEIKVQMKIQQTLIESCFNDCVNSFKEERTYYGNIYFSKDFILDDEIIMDSCTYDGEATTVKVEYMKYNDYVEIEKYLLSCGR